MKCDNDSKLYSKFLNKRNNAKKEGIRFKLTYEEFVGLVKTARLRSSDLGFSGRGYVLARYKDRGAYSVGNCRFITQRENMSERKAAKVTTKRREASRNALSVARQYVVDDYGSLSAWCARNGRKGAQARNAQVALTLVEEDAKLSKKRVNKQRVAYGTWGWKTRLSKELDLTTGRLAGFLRRNPGYEARLR